MRRRAAWFEERRTRQHVARTLACARRVGPGAVVIGDPIVAAADLEIGAAFRIWSAHRQTMVSGSGRIRIGDRVFLNAGAVVYSEIAVTLGDDVALANEVYLMDTSSHGIEGREPDKRPVVIGSGTWIGARAMVLPGVTVGSRVVVAAGSVVTRDVPDDQLVAGNPARVVRPLTYPAHCLRAWHDVFCSCPGSLLGPPVGV